MKLLNIAAISDIHLGHRRNHAREIVKNLYRALPDNAQTGALDLLVLVGDVFDNLLTAPADALVEVDLWFAYLLRLCAKHSIVLRILEGTRSHDWLQSERFNTLERMLQTGCNMRYVKTIDIEYIEPLDIHVLYVPDEANPTTEETLKEVHALLRAKGLNQVDFAFMHGQFEYQLPPVVKAPKHNAEEYLKIVRYLIFIGHVHLYSNYDRIYAQGSFDRLAHGQEEPKGHLRARVSPNGEYEVTFVENEGAMRFVTINCIGLDLEQTLQAVAKVAQGLPEGSHVRLECQPDNPILTNMELLIRTWPLLNWSKLVPSEERREEVTESEEEFVYMPITLTRENLGGMLMARIAQRGVPEAVLDAAQDILKELL